MSPRRPSPADVEAVSWRARAPSGQSSHIGLGLEADTVSGEKQITVLAFFVKAAQQYLFTKHSKDTSTLGELD